MARLMVRMPRFRRFLVFLFLVGLAARPVLAGEDHPRVAVSILPIHAIVAGVMAGVAAPDLIVRAFGSPHSYALRPSDAHRLEAADLVFWVGSSLESFLEKPLAALAGETIVVTLIERDALVRFGIRAGGAWESSPSDNQWGEVSDARFDPHVWLDPANAAVIARIAAAELGALDPARRATYAANAERVAARIATLDAGLRAMLAPVARSPYAVFHDAYGYFERRYGLNAIGSVSLSPERRPGARRLRTIRAAIKATGARCLFTEPQFGAALVAIVIEDTGVRTAVLDPLGADIRPGPDAYFTLMRRLARSLRDCLTGE